jgi:hypothetical protein
MNSPLGQKGNQGIFVQLYGLLVVALYRAPFTDGKGL